MSEAFDLALCGDPARQDVTGGEHVGHVAGQGQLLDPLRQRGMRRRLRALCLGRGRVLGPGLDRRVWLFGRSLPAALGDLAALQHRAVVRPVATGALAVILRALRHDADPAPPGTAQRLGLLGILVDRGRVGLLSRVGTRPAAHLGPELARLFGQRVDRRTAEHENAEENEQDQQRHRDVPGEQIGQDRGHGVADRPASALQVADPVLWAGDAVLDVDQAEHTGQDRHPADELPATWTVAVGMSQRPPGDEHQQDRDGPRKGANAAGHTCPDGTADVTRHVPPHGRGDHDGHADEQQAHTVAAQLGVELAGTGTDPPDDGTHDVGDAEPDARHHPRQCHQHPAQ